MWIEQMERVHATYFGVVVPLFDGRCLFYSAATLYRTCPSAPSLALGELEARLMDGCVPHFG